MRSTAATHNFATHGGKPLSTVKRSVEFVEETKRRFGAAIKAEAVPQNEERWMDSCFTHTASGTQFRWMFYLTQTSISELRGSGENLISPDDKRGIVLESPIGSVFWALKNGRIVESDGTEKIVQDFRVTQTVQRTQWSYETKENISPEWKLLRETIELPLWSLLTELWRFRAQTSGLVEGGVISVLQSIDSLETLLLDEKKDLLTKESQECLLHEIGSIRSEKASFFQENYQGTEIFKTLTRLVFHLMEISELAEPEMSR